MKQHINLNNNWLFSNHFSPEMLQEGYSDDSWEKVRLPHCPTTIPLNYFDYTSLYQTYCYRKKLILSNNLKGKNVFLSFEGIGHLSTIYLNGHIIGRHSCGYTAFQVPLLLTDPNHSKFSINPNEFIKLDGENIITICVDSRPLNLPPFGSATDFLTYGGIYREASLEIREASYIESLFTTTPEAEKQMKTLHSEVSVYGNHLRTDVRFSLYDAEGNLILRQTEPVTKPNIYMESCRMDYKLWSPEDPYLYTLSAELIKDGKIIDYKKQLVGFRSTEFRMDGFYCNGQKYKLLGINRNQCYPYVGYAMPKGPQVQDALLIKNELGLNAIRCFGAPPSKYFLDACDSLGLFVLIDLPGWSYIGDESWKEHALANLKDIILEHRHHPCIISWETRISNTKTDQEFSLSLNKLSHSLDSSRQTYGVSSSMQNFHTEDVIGYNDYNFMESKAENLSKKNTKPLFISEFGGYMHPCKTSDSESIRLQHALIYCNYFNDIMGNSDIAGAFGWCMCDYPTLPQYGSGDGISYLGLMDCFRNPKLAAYAMGSQGDENKVFAISSTMNCGDYAGGNLNDIYAFTNSGYVRLYKNGEYIKGCTEDNSQFKNLPHPPILINDFIGNQLETKENFSPNDAAALKEIFSACTKFGKNLPEKYSSKLARIMFTNGKNTEDGFALYEKYSSSHVSSPNTYTFEAINDGIISKKYQIEPIKSISLCCLADKTELTEGDFYDVSCIRIRLEDNHGNHLPYYHGTISFQTSGPLELIGPSVISVTGGYAGTYVKTTGHTGIAALIIKELTNPKIEEVVIHYHIINEKVMHIS